VNGYRSSRVSLSVFESREGHSAEPSLRGLGLLSNHSVSGYLLTVLTDVAMLTS